METFSERPLIGATPPNNSMQRSLVTPRGPARSAAPRPPAGFRAWLDDWAHFCRMVGAETPLRRLGVLLRARPLWALAAYRYGRWAYAVRPKPLSLPFRLGYHFFNLWTQSITRTYLDLEAEIEDRVWLGPTSVIRVGAGGRVGSGTCLHGHNTLGWGGRGENRGVPRVGRNVDIGPGTVLVGLVSVADGSVIGPNSVVVRSIDEPAAFLGSPARACSLPSSGLIPAWNYAPRRANKRASHGNWNISMRYEPFIENFRQDLDRYLAYRSRPTVLTKIRLLLTIHGLWATGVYRFGRALQTMRSRALCTLLWPLYRALDAAVILTTNVILHPECRIGPGLYIGHPGSIFIGPGARLGRQCNVAHMVFVGAAGPEARPGVPVIGDRVYIGVGCRILGDVVVEDGAALGAGSVILDDVPEQGVVVGNPGRVVNYRGSGDFIRLSPASA